MHNPEHGIRLRSSARTSTGQVRENNEDNIHLWTHDDFVLAIVADGMGGAAAGEEASRIAVEAIKSGIALQDQRLETLATMEDSVVTERLRGAIQAANLSIVQKASAAPEMRGMGTTVTLAFVRGTYAIVAHVGDSRAYLVDGDDQSISQITSDHSFVEALLLAGHITPEQAEEHPMKNVLYRALGQAEDVDVDMYYKRLHIGDRLVLCSDGLTRHLKPPEIAKIALSDVNPDVVSQSMIDLANARGGEDNVSVIVVSVEAATNTSIPYQDAAVLTNPHDDDETLVLKDRLSLRLRPAGSPDTDDLTDKNPLAEPQKDVEKPPTSLPLSDPKMTAERLRDDDGAPTLQLEEDITEDTRPIPDEESFSPITTPLRDDSSRQPVLEHHDFPREGRDTLIPDQ